MKAQWNFKDKQADILETINSLYITVKGTKRKFWIGSFQFLNKDIVKYRDTNSTLIIDSHLLHKTLNSYNIQNNSKKAELIDNFNTYYNMHNDD